jgi:hypothetical protein
LLSRQLREGLDKEIALLLVVQLLLVLVSGTIADILPEPLEILTLCSGFGFGA